MAQTSLNKVTLLGRLAEDPVIQNIDGEGKIVGLNLVTTRSWLESGTDREREEKEWHRVVIAEERLAAYAKAHLRKEDQVYLEGELQTASWRDETFGLRHLTRIVLWHQGNQLRRLDGPDRREPAAALCRLALVRDSRLFEAEETVGGGRRECTT